MDIIEEIKRELDKERKYLFESLFSVKPPRHLNAYTIHRSMDVYAQGFKSAADALVQATTKRQFFIDEVVYPIAYLYCHSLELSVKHIITASSEVLQRPTCPKCISKHHNLISLWKKARGNLEEIWGEGVVPWGNSEGENDSIQERLKETVKIKEGFRYPDGGELPEQFNLEHFQKVINAIHIALDNSSTELCENQEKWKNKVRNRLSNGFNLGTN